MKNLISISIVLTMFTLILSCKKDIYGCNNSSALNYSKEATKDDGSCILESDISNSDISNVEIEEFWVDFSPGVSYDSYIPNFYKENGDLLLIEVESKYISGTSYWSALPYHLGVNNAYMKAEYTESGFIWIETRYEDGTLANWTGNVSYHMRVALIKKNALIKKPSMRNLTISELKELSNN